MLSNGIRRTLVWETLEIQPGPQVSSRGEEAGRSRGQSLPQRPLLDRELSSKGLRAQGQGSRIQGTSLWGAMTILESDGDEQRGCSGIPSTHVDVYMLFTHTQLHPSAHTHNLHKEQDPHKGPTDEVAAICLPASLETDHDTSTAKELRASVAFSSQPWRHAGR